jgi:hypothetical protein
MVVYNTTKVNTTLQEFLNFTVLPSPFWSPQIFFYALGYMKVWFSSFRTSFWKELGKEIRKPKESQKLFPFKFWLNSNRVLFVDILLFENVNGLNVRDFL